MEFAVPFNEAKLTGARIEKITWVSRGPPGASRSCARPGAEVECLMAEETGGTGLGHRSISMTRVEKGLYEVTNVRGGTMLLGGEGTPPHFTPVELLLARDRRLQRHRRRLHHRQARRARVLHGDGQGRQAQDDTGNHLANIKVRFSVEFPEGRPATRRANAAQGDRDVARPPVHRQPHRGGRHAHRQCRGWRPGRLDELAQEADPVGGGVLSGDQGPSSGDAVTRRHERRDARGRRPRRCAAESCTRMRAWPFGTTGYEKPIT